MVAVRHDVFLSLLDQGIMPVLSPICGSALFPPRGQGAWGSDPLATTEDYRGAIFNVNADNVAEAVALATHADRLVFVSNVPGVLAGDRLLDHLGPAEAETLIADGTISGGMIPKVRAALETVARGVRAVCITNLPGLRQGAGTVLTAV